VRCTIRKRVCTCKRARTLRNDQPPPHHPHPLQLHIHLLSPSRFRLASPCHCHTHHRTHSTVTCFFHLSPTSPSLSTLLSISSLSPYAHYNPAPPPPTHRSSSLLHSPSYTHTLSPLSYHLFYSRSIFSFLLNTALLHHHPPPPHATHTSPRALPPSRPRTYSHPREERHTHRGKEEGWSERGGPIIE
jgi:hypothetical protein